MCPVSGAQRPHDFGRATEAVPNFRLFDQLDGATWQVSDNTPFAKHIGTLRAAVHLAALTTPTTVLFAAVFALFKPSAVVELITSPT